MLALWKRPLQGTSVLLSSCLQMRIMDPCEEPQSDLYEDDSVCRRKKAGTVASPVAAAAFAGLSGARLH